MTEEEIAKVARGLTNIQREAIRRAKEFIPGVVSLTDWQEDSLDITEDLSEDIAEPVCGDLTSHGLAVRKYLETHHV